MQQTGTDAAIILTQWKLDDRQPVPFLCRIYKNYISDFAASQKMVTNLMTRIRRMYFDARHTSTLPHSSNLPVTNARKWKNHSTTRAYSSEIGEYLEDARLPDEPMGVPELRLVVKLNILRTEGRGGWSSISGGIFSDGDISSSAITSERSWTSTINLQSPAADDLGVIRADDEAAEADSVRKRFVNLFLRAEPSFAAVVRPSDSETIFPPES